MRDLQHRLILFFSTLCFIFLSQQIFAQGTFNSEKELRNKASKFYNNDDFAECLPMYSQLLSLYPKEPEYNYRYGVCLLMAGKEKEKSILYLASAAKSPETEKEVFYYLGRAYHLNYRFDDAINTFSTYKAKAGDKKAFKYDVDREIEMCRNGKALLQNITDLTVIQKNQFPVSDYFRAYDLGSSGIKIIVKPDDLKSPIDKKRNETGILVINPGSPYIYFSSYGNEDKGQKDLYRIQSTDNFSWGRAQSLGGRLNTPYDEDYPFISSDGKSLIFSSKGHNSMGGYDVFRSVFDSISSAFGEPINLDFAINTPDDDMLYITDSKLEYAYFASRRNTDASNISVFKIRKERVPGKVILVRGNFFSGKEDNHPSAKIVLKNENGSRTLSTITPNKNGFYQVVLRQGLAYSFTVESEGFAPQTKKVSIPETSDNRPLIQEVNLQKNNGVDELSINSHLQEGPPDESTLQAMASFLKEKAGLEVNVGQQINEGLIAAAKPVAAKKTEGAKDANKDLLESAQKEAKEAEKESMELKAQYAELSALAAQNRDSSGIFKAKYESSKKPEFKKQEDLYRVKANAFDSQAREAETRYNEKKAEADWQKKYVTQMESAINAGDNQALAKLKTTRFDKEKTSVATAENKKTEQAGTENKSGVAAEIEQLKKDQAGLTDPAAREKVQKQIDQLMLEQSKASGTVVAENNQNNAAAVNPPSGDTYARLAASDKILSDAAALRKRAAKTTDPATKVRMLKEADAQTKKGQEAKIAAENKLIETQGAEIKQKQEAIGSIPPGGDDALLGKLGQENTVLMTDAQNLVQQAAKDPTTAGKAQKLERARMLNEKILANQQRLLDAGAASREQKELAYKAKMAEADANAKEAEKSEQKAAEVLASAGPIKEAREKDLTMAKNLISYAAGVKKETKKKDAENAAASYERDAARKQQSIDSIQKVADTYKAQATELLGKAERLRADAQNGNAPMGTAAAASASGTVAASEPAAASLASDPEFIKYASLKEESEKQNRAYEQAGTEAEKLKASGKNKLDRVMQVLEEAQMSGSKKDRTAALKESMQLDKEGNEEIAKSDSLTKVLPELKAKAEAAAKALQASTTALPASRLEAFNKQIEQAAAPVQVAQARAGGNAASATPGAINAAKFGGYVPGQTVEGLSYTADELRNIISSADFNSYYNLRQEGDSANFFYEMLVNKSQSISDTVKILAAQAADFMEQSDDASGNAAKSLKAKAKEKEALADKLMAKADTLFDNSKPLSQLIDKKDKETMQLIEKLDNRTASDYKIIYEKISRKVFYSNSPVVARYMPTYAEANKPAPVAEARVQTGVVAVENKTAETQLTGEQENLAEKQKQAAQAEQQKQAEQQRQAALAEAKQKQAEAQNRNKAEQENANPVAGGEIVYDSPAAPGLVFRVQVGAYNRKVTRNPFGDRFPLFGRQVNNFIVYDAGAFNNPTEAENARNYFRQNGFRDAFVTAYCYGNRISVRQAMGYIRLGTDCNKQPIPEAQLEANNTNNAITNLPPAAEQTNLKQFRELLYTVQVGVYRTLIPASKLYNLSPLYYDTIARRLIRYSVGIYNNAQDANEAKNRIVGIGIRDAFVIPYYNKRRISLQEADRIVRARGNDAFVKGAMVNVQPGAEAAAKTGPVGPELNAEEKAALRIKVQIGVFRKDVPVETMNVFLKLADKGIDIVKSADGLTTYTIGNFSSLTEAESLRNEALAAGLADAFLVGYTGNKKISIERARAILQGR